MTSLVQTVTLVAWDRAHSSPPICNSTTSEAAYRNHLDISDNTTSAPAQGPSTIDLHASHLISSPYHDLPNRLVLDHLETPYRLFAFALTSLKPIRHDYATAPYLESFNWPDVFAHLRHLCRQTGFVWKQLRFYTVIFRSVLLPGIDRGRLALLDQMSHEEACASGGLLKYWFGSTDAELKNLATCLWRSRQDAAAGGAGPWHAQARAAARTMYRDIDFYTHQLVVENGAESWRLDVHVEQHPHR